MLCEFHLNKKENHIALNAMWRLLEGQVLRLLQ